MDYPSHIPESTFSQCNDDEREEGLHFPLVLPWDVPHNQTKCASTMFPLQRDPVEVPPDLRIRSADGVLFFCHQIVLFIASNNFFNAQLPLLVDDANLPLLLLPERSAVLSVMLHTLYGRPNQRYSLAIEDTIEAIDTLARYGVSPKACMEREQPLWSLLRYYAPVRPLDIYAAAAQYDVEDIAVYTSGYMLEVSIWDLTEAHIHKMGPLYLKRLALLHEQRMTILRQLIFTAPESHDMTSTCGYNDQDTMKRAWGQGIADLAWVATPGLSTKIMRVTLEAHGANLKCSSCLANFKSNVKSRLLAWSEVERTVHHHTIVGPAA